MFLFVSWSLSFSLACSRLLTHNVSPVKFSRLMLLRVNDDQIVNTRVLCTSSGPASCVLRGGGLTMSQRAHPGPSEANSILSPYCPTTAVSTKDKIGLARSTCGEGGREQDKCLSAIERERARSQHARKQGQEGGWEHTNAESRNHEGEEVDGFGYSFGSAHAPHVELFVCACFKRV